MNPARWFRRFAAAAALVGFAACLSPTLPLPPPDEPDAIARSEDGRWTIQGNCTSGARIFVVNEATGRGVIWEDRENTGRYEIELEGVICDPATVSEELAAERSEPTRFLIEPMPRDGSSACR